MSSRTPAKRLSRFLLGVDLGGTKLSAALATTEGLLVVERTVPTAPEGGRAIVAQIGALARDMIADCAGRGQRGSVDFCQVGAPGVLDGITGAIRMAPNIPGLDSFDVAAALRRELGCAIGVENDVAVAMFGEHCVGAARGVRNAAFVSLGTGIGCGILAKGQVMRGASGAAGEIAYLPFGADPADRSARIKGALERTVGSAGIRAAYAAAACLDREISVRDIFLRLLDGDAAAAQVLDAVASHVANAILSLTAILDPECLILGGTIGMQSTMRDRIRVLLDARAFRPIDLRAAALGSRAGLIGAVAMGFAHTGLNPQLVRS